MTKKKPKEADEGPVLDFEQPIRAMEEKIEELERFASETDDDLTGQIQELQDRCNALKREIFDALGPWQRVQIARHPNRPVTSDYLSAFVDDFLELHGDRYFSDDRAILTGFGRIEGQKFLIVAHRKGKTTNERIECNFGSAHPEGYRKSLRKMKMAAKFNIPILTFINTPGAYPGIGAEERGQAHAIAENIMEMSRLRTPVICVVLAEGGSGGALGIGVGDRVLMLENAYYSVISPEGCAAILWKTAEKAAEAAAILRLTAPDLLKFGVIDEIVPEPLGGAHRDHNEMTDTLKKAILKNYEMVRDLDMETLLQRRYEKLRDIGEWLENPSQDASRRTLQKA